MFSFISTAVLVYLSLKGTLAGLPPALNFNIKHPARNGIYSHPNVPYKIQEDAFFNSANPSRDAVDNQSAGFIFFLNRHTRFNVHKSTLFTRLSREAEVNALREYFTRNEFNITAFFAKQLTYKDVEGISNKHSNLATCDHFAELIMGAPSSTLSAISPDCAFAVITKASRYTKDASGSALFNRLRRLAVTFATNVPHLNTNVWSQHAEYLHQLSSTQVVTPALAPVVTPITDYSKYGDRLRYLVQNPDFCANISAERLLSTLSKKQATFITSGACLSQLQGLSNYQIAADEIQKQRHIQKLPAQVFTEFDGQLHESVFPYLTAEQLSKWGTKFNVEDRCVNLRVDRLGRGKARSLTSECLQSFLLSVNSNVKYAAQLGSAWSSIKAETIEKLSAEAFSRIDPSDLKYINVKALNSFVEKNPDFCSGESMEEVDIEGIRVRIPQCFKNLPADKQIQVIQKQRSTFPATILAQFDKSSMEKLGTDWIRHLTGAQIKSLGRDIKSAEEHPCAALSKTDLLNNELLLKSLSNECHAALTCMCEFDGSDLANLPASFSSMLPYEKLIEALGEDAKKYFEKLEETGFKNLVGKESFCKQVSKEHFSAIPEKNLTVMDAKCAAVLSFKKELTQKQVRAFPAPAFKLFDKKAAAEIKITDLSPEQFEQLSAEVPKENNAGANLTKEVLAALPATHTAKLSKSLLEATPVGALAAFDTKEKVSALPPKSLSGLSKEQVAAIPGEAMPGFTAAQIQELGSSTTDLAKHPLHLLLDEQHKKHFSKETLELASKRLEEETKRINALDKKTAASSGVMSASVSAVALAGLMAFMSL